MPAQDRPRLGERLGDPALLSPLPSDPLVFRMRLDDATFPLQADLSEHDATPAPIYSNAPPAPSGQLVLKSGRVGIKESFTWPGGGEARFTLAGRPLAGSARELKVDGVGTAQFDLDETAGVVQIRGASVAAGAPITIGYNALPADRRGEFAMVEIQPAAASGTSNGLGEYRLGFRPRQAYWVYYLLTDRKDEAATFRIVEDPPDSQLPLRFTRTAPRDLDVQPDPDDALAAQLAATAPGARRLRFVSDDPVPCRQNPWKTLRLLAGATPLVSRLPNPSPSQFTSVTLTDPGGSAPTRRDAWYSVIPYLTR